MKFTFGSVLLLPPARAPTDRGGSRSSTRRGPCAPRATGASSARRSSGCRSSAPRSGLFLRLSIGSSLRGVALQLQRRALAFGTSILGCIEADLYNQISILQYFSRSFYKIGTLLFHGSEAVGGEVRPGLGARGAAAVRRRRRAAALLRRPRRARRDERGALRPRPNVNLASFQT